MQSMRQQREQHNYLGFQTGWVWAETILNLDPFFYSMDQYSRSELQTWFQNQIRQKALGPGSRPNLET